jgi:phosphoglycerol transferase MdoB-like AlkP superfamily enzyme
VPAFLFFLLNQLILIFLLMVNRIALLLRFGPEEIWRLYRGDVLPALERGFRFDVKVAAFLFLPLLVLAIADLFFKKPEHKKKIFFLLKRTALCLWVFLLITIMVDHQYYAFFQSHLTVLFFGIAEDDTIAVLKSMWTDHPVVRWLCLISLIYYGIWSLFNYFSAKQKTLPHFSLKKMLYVYAIYIPIHVLCMRGSFTIFPLMRDDAVISNHPFINYLVINPYFALKEAMQEKQNGSKYVAESKILEMYQQQSIESGLKDLDKENWQQLFATSPKNASIEQNPPNVVYVMMESWSNFLIDYNSPTNNMLSSFTPHSKEDFLFRNTISAMNSTLPAIEGMLLGKEIRDVLIWNSPFRFSSFSTSLARVYKNKGYRTIFITSGKLGWRNINQWIPKQGFDEAYGQNEILQHYPDAQDCSWGVYDEYSFRRAQDFLLESKNSHVPYFIYVMTTSNHTPYEIPTHFKPEPNSIPKDLNPSLTTSEELAKKSLVGYQYSNKSLGDFLSFVKGDAQLKEKTVVVAVGDHNSWMLAPRNSEVMPYTKTLSVPFYFYVPNYLKKNITYDPLRPASHKDIISTLVPLTLSEAKYFNMGNNLFENGNKKNHFFGLNSDGLNYKLFSAQGDDKAVMNRKARAFLAINHIYFQREFCLLQASWCQ